MGSTVAFTALGEAFTAGVPVALAGVPVEVPEPVPGEDTEFSAFRAAGAPLLAEAAGGAAFGLVGEPVVVGVTVAGAPVVGATVPGATVPGEAVPGTAPFSAFSGLGGTVGRRSARISMARAVPA